MSIFVLLVQVSGRWKVNQPTLAVLCKEAQRLIQNFSEFSVRHVDRVWFTHPYEVLEVVRA